MRMSTNQNTKPEINAENKLLWTIKEASAYSTIGERTLRELAKQPDCPFSMKIGRRICIKRKEFEEYISNTQEIK